MARWRQPRSNSADHSAQNDTDDAYDGTGQKHSPTLLLAVFVVCTGPVLASCSHDLSLLLDICPTDNRSSNIGSLQRRPSHSRDSNATLRSEGTRHVSLHSCRTPCHSHEAHCCGAKIRPEHCTPHASLWYCSWKNATFGATDVLGCPKAAKEGPVWHCRHEPACEDEENLM